MGIRIEDSICIGKEEPFVLTKDAVKDVSFTGFFPFIVKYNVTYIKLTHAHIGKSYRGPTRTDKNRPGSSRVARVFGDPHEEEFVRSDSVVGLGWDNKAL